MTDSMMMAPPEYAIRSAIAAAVMSPCAKSKRGAAVYRPSHGTVVGIGYNGQPEPFSCTGIDRCSARCAELCVHAEARAIRDALMTLGRREGDPLRWCSIVHIKVIGGEPVPSGGPSCTACSKEILDCRVGAAIEGGVWLLEPQPDGWRCYDAAGFHRISLGARIAIDGGTEGRR